MMTKAPELLLLLLATVGGAKAQAQRETCTQGADCGGQVFAECGTACPLICGQPAAEFCTENCVAEHQCPNGQCFNERSGVCSTAEDAPDRRSTCTADSDCPESADDYCGYSCLEDECVMWCASGPEPPQTATNQPEKCNGADEPLTDSNGVELYCGRGVSRVDCPADSRCEIHPTDAWAVCCPVETGTIVRASLSLDGELEVVAGAEGSPARRQFETDFATDVAELLRVASQRVVIASIVSGSVVVTFDIMPDGERGVEVSTVEAVFAAAGVSLPTLGVTTAAPATVVTAAARSATDVEPGNLDTSPSPPILQARSSGVANVAATTMCGVAVAVASVIF